MPILNELEVNKALPQLQNYAEIEQHRSFWHRSYNLPLRFLWQSDALGNSIINKHACEDKSDNEQRKQITKPRAYLQQIINQFNSYLFSQDITRTGLSDEFLANADGEGSSLDTIMSQATLMAQIQGAHILMPDSTAPGGELSQAQATAANVQPVIRSYDISSLVYFNDDNEYIIRFSEEFARYYNDEFYIDIALRKNNRRTVIIEALGEPVVHGYFRAPIVILRPRLWYDSQAAKLAEICVTIFNLQSLLMSELQNKTFSHYVLTGTFDMDANDNVQIGSGKSTVLQTDSGSSPASLEVLGGSDVSQADSLRTSITEEIEALYLTAALENPKGNLSVNAESGVSKAIGFEKTNAVVRSLADAAEASENELWALFGIDAESSYPDRFDQVLNPDSTQGNLD